MPSIGLDPVNPPYANETQVTNLLGTLGNRLPAWVSIPSYLAIAHATVLDELANVYPGGIPVFEGPALDVVSWAEAKLATAEILDAIRVNLPTDAHDAADTLRASALAALSDGVVGYPAGSLDGVDVDTDPSTPGVVTTVGPRVSSFTSLSAFPDPYADARTINPYALL
jgi:hypothetical protein